MENKEARDEQKVRKSLAQLVDKMHEEFSRSKNITYGYQDYQSAEIHEYTCADTRDAVAFSYYGHKFKLHCGGPHFSDRSESSDLAGLSAYDGNVRLNLENYARDFSGYAFYGSIPSPLRVLGMKHLGEKKYEITTQIASSQNTYIVDFEKRKVEKREKEIEPKKPEIKK